MAANDVLFTFDELVRRVAPQVDIAGRRWKVVRHRHNDSRVPDLIELFHLDRDAFNYYQSDQGSDIFGACDGIFSFLGLPGGLGLFVGGYRVKGARPQEHPPLDEVPHALRKAYEGWREESTDPFVRYQLERDPCFEPLELRAVIDWGKGALAWHQWKLAKPVVELRNPHAMQVCPAYKDIDVSVAKLRYLFRHEEANRSWRERLSAVGGIYLLTDHANARLYVGQAGGGGGFWGRWSAYADQKTGNVAVDPAFASGELRPETTNLSILEVVPRGAMNKARLDELESRWKVRLCSRVTGYNRN